MGCRTNPECVFLPLEDPEAQGRCANHLWQAAAITSPSRPEEPKPTRLEKVPVQRAPKTLAHRKPKKASRAGDRVRKYNYTLRLLRQELEAKKRMLRMETRRAIREIDLEIEKLEVKLIMKTE